LKDRDVVRWRVLSYWNNILFGELSEFLLTLVNKSNQNQDIVKNIIVNLIKNNYVLKTYIKQAITAEKKVEIHNILGKLCLSASRELSQVENPNNSLILKLLKNVDKLSDSYSEAFAQRVQFVYDTLKLKSASRAYKSVKTDLDKAHKLIGEWEIME